MKDIRTRVDKELQRVEEIIGELRKKYPNQAFGISVKPSFWWDDAKSSIEVSFHYKMACQRPTQGGNRFEMHDTEYLDCNTLEEAYKEIRSYLKGFSKKQLSVQWKDK